MDSIKKLKLNKTTVRNLTEDEIRQVDGGATWLCPVFTRHFCECKGTSTYGPSQQMIC